MLFRADKITVTINNDLTIPVEFFNQYEPKNTIKNYDNIWYGGINDVNATITNNTQADISTELQNEINQVNTINDLAQYTEQYFKNKFNEINKIIRIN
jgi:hypothetical protein